MPFSVLDKMSHIEDKISLLFNGVRWIPTPGIHLSGSLECAGFSGFHPCGYLECVRSCGDPPRRIPGLLDAAGIHLGGSQLNPIHSRDPPRWLFTEVNTLLGSTWVVPLCVRCTTGIHQSGSPLNPIHSWVPPRRILTESSTCQGPT